jgi:hypothetical protein
MRRPLAARGQQDRQQDGGDAEPDRSARSGMDHGTIVYGILQKVE